MKVSVNSEYTSVACNRIPEIADWNSEGIICYGASNAIALYDTNKTDGDPLTVLTHHKSRVNSVKWLQRQDGRVIEFLSCSADKTAAIWTANNGAWKVTSVLEGHTNGITSIAGVYTSDNDLIVLTASIDSTVKIWKRKDETTTEIQTISLNSGLCLTLKAHLLPSVCQPILFLALDDFKVHVYVNGPEPEDPFHRVHLLTGHEDWVRGLDVLDVDDDTILLASCSQDTYIRVWRIRRVPAAPAAAPAAPAAPSEVRVERRVFAAAGQSWAAALDAVLAAHEGWVYGVQWAPTLKGKAPDCRLLSSSLDKTVILWEPDAAGAGAGAAGAAGAGAWVERVRAGEAGGGGLGFYGGRFGPRGASFMAHGYTGSFHIWNYDESSGSWAAGAPCGGHGGPVEDVCWVPRARLLLSASADQTTRAHAPCRRVGGGRTWHEVARPQTHGHALAALAPLPAGAAGGGGGGGGAGGGGGGAGAYVAAAEEKVLRVFRPTNNFRANYAALSGERLEGGGGEAEGATVPSLGLSNKAVYAGDAGGGAGGAGGGGADDDNDGYFAPVVLTQPPTEETLAARTLWPETRKLYGHGHEARALAAAAGRLASAARAAAAADAAIIIWDTESWQQIQKLESHRLTVTQLAFSPDGRRLLAVSRDRRWTLYQWPEGSESFELVASSDTCGPRNAHARIIWCCAWAHDGEVFATGSRDGKVCAWSQDEGEYGLHSRLELADASVTALSFAPARAARGRLLAAGLDSGVVRLYGVTRGADWPLLHELDNSRAHHLSVRRLAFRAECERDGERAGGAGERDDNTRVLLASGGADNLVRIYSVEIQCC